MANIEEETVPEDSNEFELGDELDIGDELIPEPSIAEEPDLQLKPEEDFISVASLLSDSFEETSVEEPYNKTNIDVGLNEFPEFSGDLTKDDIDDDNGMEAKLDLAKVYIEIGDQENAEIILMDVVTKGDVQQQLDAQQLLDNIRF